MGCQELEWFLGLAIYMPTIAVFGYQCDWSQTFSILHLYQAVSRDCWKQIRGSLHFNDSAPMLSATDSACDKLSKPACDKPIVDSSVSSFSHIPMNQMLSVDERIVLFSGCALLRQYLPKKPYKWEHKPFVLSGSDGIIHYFEMYMGRIDRPGCLDLGAYASMVLRLAQMVPAHKNRLLYCDSWSTSLLLQSQLAKKEIYSLGTVRSNRPKGCRLMDDKAMKAAGRRTPDEKEGMQNSLRFRMVEW